MGKKNNSKSLLGYIFAALVLVGFILVIVGMFVGQMTTKNPITASSTINLFDDSWGTKEVLGKTVGVSNTFAIISFIIALIGALILVADSVLNVFLGKNLKIVRLVGIAVTFIGAILILVSGLVMVSNMWDQLTLSNIIGGDGKEALQRLGYDVGCGAGVWLGFIGGLVAAIAGGLSMVLNK